MQPSSEARSWTVPRTKLLPYCAVIGARVITAPNSVPSDGEAYVSDSGDER